MKDIVSDMVALARRDRLQDELDALRKGEIGVSDLINYDMTNEDVEYLREQVGLVSASIDSYTWGLDAIDEKITTPKKGKVIVMVSDENQGKSTFSYFFARNNFKKYGHDVVYFNLEQTKDEVINDMATQYCEATKLQIRDNEHLTNPLYIKRKRELNEQEDICFLGRKAENVTTMREIRQRIKEEPMDMLILDNLTCIEGEGGDRNTQIKNIALELISMSQQRNIPIVLVHHYRKRDTANNALFRDVHNMEGSGSLKNLVPIVIQVARNVEPTSRSEFAEFSIREGKLRGGAKKETVTVYHNKGEFEEGFEGIVNGF